MSQVLGRYNVSCSWSTASGVTCARPWADTISQIDWRCQLFSFYWCTCVAVRCSHGHLYHERCFDRVAFPLRSHPDYFTTLGDQAWSIHVLSDGASGYATSVKPFLGMKQNRDEHNHFWDSAFDLMTALMC